MRIPLTSRRSRRLDHRRHRGVERRRVPRVVPGERRVQQRGVEHGPADGTGLVEAGGERDHPEPGHLPVGRLHPDEPAHGRRLADRAAGVGADGQRRLERGHRGRAAAGRSTGHAGQPPRVARRLVRRALGRRAHRELVHVGLAEDDEPGLAQLAGDRRVVRRAPALEDAGARGGRDAAGGEDVLQPERDAGEPPELLAVRAPLVDRAGGAQRALHVDVQEGADGLVGGDDPVQVGLRGLHATRPPLGQAVREVGRGQADEVRRPRRAGRLAGRTHCSSRMRGTRNRPSSAAGRGGEDLVPVERGPDDVGPEDVDPRARRCSSAGCRPTPPHRPAPPSSGSRRAAARTRRVRRRTATAGTDARGGRPPAGSRSCAHRTVRASPGGRAPGVDASRVGAVRPSRPTSSGSGAAARAASGPCCEEHGEAVLVQQRQLQRQRLVVLGPARVGARRRRSPSSCSPSR